jgi:hypothetical protein
MRQGRNIVNIFTARTVLSNFLTMLVLLQDLNLKEVLSFITQMGKTLWDLETITLEI